jgi:hypothetical protein
MILFAIVRILIKTNQLVCILIMTKFLRFLLTLIKITNIINLTNLTNYINLIK